MTSRWLSIVVIGLTAGLTSCIWSERDTVKVTTAATNWTERTAASMESVADSVSLMASNTGLYAQSLNQYAGALDRTEKDFSRMEQDFSRISQSIDRLTEALSKRVDKSTEVVPYLIISAVSVAAAIVVYLVGHTITKRMSR